VTLPPRPIVFHGRDELVSDMVRLLFTHDGVSLAVLGSGGMGKTSVALTLLYHGDIVARYGPQRLFLSCEALVDADAIVVSLAKQLHIPVSADLLAAVIPRLSANPRTVLVLDNLETVWLSGGAPSDAVDRLLGQLAQITSLSLIITCRGTELPQTVQWTNEATAVLEPFSLEAALQTFQEKAARKLTDEEIELASQLLNAVDRMPLAVSLLGQLARRGNSVLELLVRWNRERTSLLRTHGAGRINNVEVSIQLSIKMLLAADDTRESLHLLSLCSMLPDGVRRNVFEQLRPQFKYIDRARDTLLVYALISLDSDRTLKTLSPVRHLVLDHHPAVPNHHDALCRIYVQIANNLPIGVDEHFKERAKAAVPEMGNLPSLLLMLVDRPSEDIVAAVNRFTRFAHWEQPTLTVASALLPHLEPHPKWKATCLMRIGQTQVRLGDYRSAIGSLGTASRLFLEIGDQSNAAWCNLSAAEPHVNLGEYDQAESLLNQARDVYAKMGDVSSEATCRMDLGRLMMKNGCPAAIEHLTAARQIFNTLKSTFQASLCSESLGVVYLALGDLDSAATELEAARSVLAELGDKFHAAQSTDLLGTVYRLQGKLILAEQFLGEAEKFYRNTGNRFGLARSAEGFGNLRRDQGRQDEAIAHYKIAYSLNLKLDNRRRAQICLDLMEGNLSTVHTDG